MSAPQKIVHVITGLGTGGAERVLSQVVLPRNLSPFSHLVVSLTDEGHYGEELRAAGVPVIALRTTGATTILRSVFALARIIRREKPAVVMTWLYHADLAGLLACMIARFPTSQLVWNIRCSDIDFSRYAMSTGLVAKILTRLSWWPGTVATNALAGRRVHEQLGYRPRRWVYLPNGVDLDVWRPDPAERARVRAEIGLRPDEVAVVVVARNDPQKDHPTLMRAVSAFADGASRVRIVLIGLGTETFAEEGPHILALGPRKDVPRLLHGMDLFCLSSAFGEGFPNAVGESMACELPGVVTDVGDAREILGPCGRVVPPGNPEALSSALQDLVGLPVEERIRLGEAARDRIATRFSRATMDLGYEKLFSEITGQASGGRTSSAAEASAVDSAS